MTAELHDERLYAEALHVLRQIPNDEFSLDNFQRRLRVGFVTRDRLLMELIDRNVIRRLGTHRFAKVTP